MCFSAICGHGLCLSSQVGTLLPGEGQSLGRTANCPSVSGGSVARIPETSKLLEGSRARIARTRTHKDHML